MFDDLYASRVATSPACAPLRTRGEETRRQPAAPIPLPIHSKRVLLRFPTPFRPPSPPCRPIKLLRRLVRIPRLVSPRITAFSSRSPRSAEMVSSMSPRELLVHQSARKGRKKGRGGPTLIKAVVAPMAAATGTLGKTSAPTHGSAVPITVPASAALPAAIRVYFCSNMRKSARRKRRRERLGTHRIPQQPPKHKLQHVSERFERRAGNERFRRRRVLGIGEVGEM